MDPMKGAAEDDPKNGKFERFLRAYYPAVDVDKEEYRLAIKNLAPLSGSESDPEKYTLNIKVPFQKGRSADSKSTIASLASRSHVYGLDGPVGDDFFHFLRTYYPESTELRFREEYRRFSFSSSLCSDELPLRMDSQQDVPLWKRVTGKCSQGTPSHSNLKQRSSAQDNFECILLGEDEGVRLAALTPALRQIRIARTSIGVTRQPLWANENEMFGLMNKSWNEILTMERDCETALSKWSFAWGIQRKSELYKFLREGAKSQCRLVKSKKLSSGLVIRLVIALILAYADLYTDIILGRHYYNSGQTKLGLLTFLFPVLCTLFHTFLAHKVNKDDSGVSRWYHKVIALLGLKPVYDTYKVLSGKRNKGEPPPLRTLLIGRGGELALECIPQAFLQTYALFSQTCVIQNAEPNDMWGDWHIQISCLITSLCAAAFIALNVDYDFDLSPHYRKTEKKLWGWIPPSSMEKRCLLLIVEFFFLAGFFAMKLASFGVLGVMYPYALAGFLVFDWLLSVGLRLLAGTFSFYGRDMGTDIHSVVLSMIIYAINACLPMFLFRLPHFMGGLVYTGTLIYGYVTSVAFYLLYRFLYSGDDHGDNIKAIVLVGALISVLALFVIIKFIMVPRKSFLWFSKLELKEHFREYYWKNVVYTDLGHTEDAHKASLLATFRPKYWDKPAVRAWLSENWCEWNAYPPSWFDERWKNRLPLDVVPSAERVWRNHRRRRETGPCSLLFCCPKPSAISPE